MATTRSESGGRSFPPRRAAVVSDAAHLIEEATFRAHLALWRAPNVVCIMSDSGTLYPSPDQLWSLSLGDV